MYEIKRRHLTDSPRGSSFWRNRQHYTGIRTFDLCKTADASVQFQFSVWGINKCGVYLEVVVIYQ